MRLPEKAKPREAGNFTGFLFATLIRQGLKLDEV
uniref:Uncharacterized protein n=1 Tax=Myoviridae sp. ctTK08 TaxID=2826656 RepID=A0A8S5QX57_9CAUD|nr:MAG TPA: hypothetical protein [Myoviridae sp. ctTK08]